MQVTNFSQGAAAPAGDSYLQVRLEDGTSVSLAEEDGMLTVSLEDSEDNGATSPGNVTVMLDAARQGFSLAALITAAKAAR